MKRVVVLLAVVLLILGGLTQVDAKPSWAVKGASSVYTAKIVGPDRRVIASYVIIWVLQDVKVESGVFKMYFAGREAPHPSEKIVKWSVGDNSTFLPPDKLSGHPKEVVETGLGNLTAYRVSEKRSDVEITSWYDVATGILVKGVSRNLKNGAEAIVLIQGSTVHLGGGGEQGWASMLQYVVPLATLVVGLLVGYVVGRKR